eukprot:m.98149 g.98149  ORF g.98149 m.98149 type:complete len:437 (-) comp22085_c1_seq2:33-1343(-)
MEQICLPHLPFLTCLSIRFCRGSITLAANVFSQTPALTSLKIIRCPQFTTLPSSIGQCQKLTLLEIQCPKFHLLPSSIGDCSQIETLSLRDSGVTELPASIGQLHKLRSLDMTCSMIKEFPAALANLTNLHSVLFDECSELSQIPDQVSHTFSAYFSLFGCQKLKTLPEKPMLNLISLTLLACDSLVGLPESLPHMSKLTEISISNCAQFSHIPSGLGRLPALKGLMLAKLPQLTSIPEEVCDVLTLQCLTAMDCGLTSLPLKLHQLRNLEHFSVLGCPDLHELPPLIGTLPKIQSFALTAKNFPSLPLNLGHLRRTSSYIQVSGKEDREFLPCTVYGMKVLSVGCGIHVYRPAAFKHAWRIQLHQYYTYWPSVLRFIRTFTWVATKRLQQTDKTWVCLPVEIVWHILEFIGFDDMNRDEEEREGGEIGGLMMSEL